MQTSCTQSRGAPLWHNTTPFPLQKIPSPPSFPHTVDYILILSSISATANTYNVEWVIICYSHMNELIEYCPVSILINSRTNHNPLSLAHNEILKISIRGDLSRQFKTLYSRDSRRTVFFADTIFSVANS